jgi:hypothetical protein
MSDLSKFAVLGSAIVGAAIAFAATTISASGEDFRCDRTGINADKDPANIDRTGSHILGLCDRHRVVQQFNVIRKAPPALPESLVRVLDRL